MLMNSDVKKKFKNLKMYAFQTKIQKERERKHQYSHDLCPKKGKKKTHCFTSKIIGLKVDDNPVFGMGLLFVYVLYV